MKIQISKKLTPIVLFLSVFSLIVFSNASVQGHSPNSATLEYDEINSKLNVTFSHSVSDPNSHYIESVVIKVNGTEVETMDYTSQPTTNTFTYQYDINAGPGAEIEVTGYCNQAGSVSNTLTVP